MVVSAHSRVNMQALECWYDCRPMIGWYLDILVGYLIRRVIRFVRTWRSKKWSIEKGTLSSTTCPLQPIRRPVAEIGYTYIHNGEYYSGVYRKGLLSSGSAKDYIDQFVVGTEIYLRVNPTQPETSVFVE